MIPFSRKPYIKLKFCAGCGQQRCLLSSINGLDVDRGRGRPAGGLHGDLGVDC